MDFLVALWLETCTKLRDLSTRVVTQCMLLDVF